MARKPIMPFDESGDMSFLQKFRSSTLNNLSQVRQLEAIVDDFDSLPDDFLANERQLIPGLNCVYVGLLFLNLCFCY